MQIILESFPSGKLMPAPNTKQRGSHDICMQATPVCLMPYTYASCCVCIAAPSTAIMTVPGPLAWLHVQRNHTGKCSILWLEAYLLDSGKFLQWMWFLEATFTPHLSELHHHKMVLPDDKKVPEVQYVHVLYSAYAI